MAEIVLLSGKKQSGKTTALFRFAGKNPCRGVLMPDIDGERCLYFIEEKRIVPLRPTPSETPLVIGKYSFSGNAFLLARKYLVTASPAEYTLIDEFGPLEFEGKGYNPELEFMLQKKGISSRFIISVRESLTNLLAERLQNSGHQVMITKVSDNGEIEGI